MPIVTVIIPTFNRGTFLREAIASVVVQSFQDWELFVIDDGSTDPIETIVSSFSDNRIHYHWQLNQGASVARNTGIQLAHGKYVAFLDSDDLWYPDYLKRKVNFAEKNPKLVLIGGGCCYIDESGNQILQKTEPRKCITVEHLSIWTAFPGGTCNIFALRDALLAINGFEPRLSDSEDRFLMRRLAESGSVESVNSVDVAIRVHPTIRNRRDLSSLIYSRSYVTKSITNESVRRRSRSWDFFVIGNANWAIGNRYSAMVYWVRSFLIYHKQIHPELRRFIPLLDKIFPRFMTIVRVNKRLNFL